jgi:hypothetical protein
MVSAALRSTELGLCKVTVTVTGTLAVLAGKTRLVVPLPARATVELNARLQDRLIGMTVTLASAVHTEPKPGEQAERPLKAPVALVTVTVSGKVPGAVCVNEAYAATVVPFGMELGIAGLKTSPVLSWMATLIKSSWPVLATVT